MLFEIIRAFQGINHAQAVKASIKVEVGSGSNKIDVRAASLAMKLLREADPLLVSGQHTSAAANMAVAEKLLNGEIEIPGADAQDIAAEMIDLQGGFGGRFRLTTVPRLGTDGSHPRDWMA